jgi:3-oxoacyl-(acyl-carrier-protein) synthase
VRVIKKRLIALKELDARWQIPPAPWTCVSANRIWNIDNIPAAQITMLGRIHGTSFAPIGACSGFDIALGLGVSAIRDNRAKAVVVGMTDPSPHPLLLGAFYDARVISCDAKISRPLEGLKGTHVSGGANVWIIGDLDTMLNRGHVPLGAEIVATGSSSDAYHIITPSNTGPRLAIQQAIDSADIEPQAIDTWDLHATATPGDWTELQNTTEIIGNQAVFTARKGIFGHGMSVGGGWELTAQHMAISEGELFACLIDRERMHPDIREMTGRIVTDERRTFDGELSGKINMGIGGVNGVVISKVWRFDPTVRQMARILDITVEELRARLADQGLETTVDELGIERVSYEVYRKLTAAPA